MEKTIERLVPAGAVNRRSSDHANRMIVTGEDYAGISPFLTLVEDWFRAPAGFPTHPHRGMQTVTFVLDGALEHRDHTGGHGVLRQGDVQWMTAGHGVMHSELPHERETAHTLQLWLNLPGRQKMIPARYVNQLGAEVPSVKFPGAEVRLYAGKLGDVASPHGSDWPMSLMDIGAEAGASLVLEVPAADRGFIHLIEGEADLGGGPAHVRAGDVAWFEPREGGSGYDTLRLDARSKLRALLYSAPPIDEPVVAYGPFVMNSEAEIRAAFDDYRSGRFVG
ncbi:MAG: pirin family protein [Stellaceae bacterium]